MSCHKPYKILLWFHLSLLLLLSHAQLAQSGQKGIWLSDEVQLKLGDAFLREKEYYRAITEYKKLLILFPDSEKADCAVFRVGLAYYKGEEYESCASSLSSFKARYPTSENVIEAQYVEGLCLWKLKRYQSAMQTFDGIAGTYPDSPYGPLSLAAASLVALDEEDIPASRARLERLTAGWPNTAEQNRAQEAAPLLNRYQRLPHKSKALAAVLSAVIPGTGYIYAGHYGDGITAFLINALWIAAAVTGIQAEYYAVSGVLAGVGLPFYFGNIYGSANAAKKWNLKVKRELRDQIYLALDFKF